MSRRILTGLIAMTVAGIGLLSPAPASAAPGDQVECYGGSYGMPGHSIRCFLETDTGQSQQAWTINGASYGPGAGDTFITFGCTVNVSYTVDVSYLDGSGINSEVGTSYTCGTMNP